MVTSWSGRNSMDIASPAHGSRCEDPKICTWFRSAGEGLDPIAELEERRERATWCPGRGYLQQRTVAPDAPSFADQRAGHLDPRRREILSEHAIAQRTGELGLPVVEILTCIHVDGLIVATVQLLIADRVADKAAAEATSHGARRPH